MDEKMAKLKEYLQMETEIAFEEFKTYYTGVIEQLNKTYSEMDQAACFQARYICSIIQGNAESRAQRSKVNGKAFKKMAAKCGFWVDAIDHRLKKEGMTQNEIDVAMGEINKDAEQ
ncbi:MULTISPECIES: hypothetical protein [Dehalobacter]|jgi:hypothetical protein|uniref:Uncharacterized protein n=1 Tax=Dehalobacter restrictus TaxID=55583 RepID=A0A857DJ94_9FIRM|nr:MULTISPECIES: hypothetical protein [Dehalobacter]MCG1026131.1 hypothetical protein [Dehalobacter sp.]MDJ0305062.1 hypothetical protein [Dehalobacter sp.]OCZ53464.1 hypothetical protein A7D23_07920 [Dehalobacter sp. TeCB1]QHA00425.1 hypothetical protein GQ588_07185 [Dehalobacter restrictus]